MAEQTVTGLPDVEEAVLLALLDAVSDSTWYKQHKAMSDMHYRWPRRIADDAERIGIWADTIETLGRPFEPAEKRGCIKFLIECAHKVGSWNNDDINLVDIAPDTIARQNLMHLFDLWIDREDDEPIYQVGQSEEDWRGGRMAFLLHFFACKIDPEIEKEENR